MQSVPLPPAIPAHLHTLSSRKIDLAGGESTQEVPHGYRSQASSQA